MQAWMAKGGARYIGEGGSVASTRQAVIAGHAGEGYADPGTDPTCRGVLVYFLGRSCLPSLREFPGY